jgi:hypothetical protein
LIASWPTPFWGLLVDAGDTEAKETVHQRLAQGDLTALAAFGDIRDLHPDVASTLMAALAAGVRSELAEVAAHTYVVRSTDPGDDLTLLCTCFPDLAVEHWDLLVQFLADSRVAGAHKRRICLTLTRRAHDLPADVRARLAQTAPSIADQPNPFGATLGRPLGGAATLLGLAVGGYDEAEAAAAIAGMLAGKPQQRCDAAVLLGQRDRPEDTLGLVALLGDAHPRVRAEAAGALAHRLRLGRDDALAIAGLTRAVDDPGALVPYAISQNLDAASLAHPEVHDLAVKLSRHTSALVRDNARTTLGETNGDGTCDS